MYSLDYLQQQYGNIYTLKELSTKWNIGIQSLLYAISRKRLNAFDIDKMYYVSEKEFKKFFYNRKVDHRLKEYRHMNLTAFKDIIYNSNCDIESEDVVKKQINEWLLEKFDKIGGYDRITTKDKMDFHCYINQIGISEKTNKEVRLEKGFYIKVRCNSELSYFMYKEIERLQKKKQVCCIVSSLYDLKAFLKERFNILTKEKGV